MKRFKNPLQCNKTATERIDVIPCDSVTPESKPESHLRMTLMVTLLPQGRTDLKSRSVSLIKITICYLSPQGGYITSHVLLCIHCAVGFKVNKPVIFLRERIKRSSWSLELKVDSYALCK